MKIKYKGKGLERYVTRDAPMGIRCFCERPIQGIALSMEDLALCHPIG